MTNSTTNHCLNCNNTDTDAPLVLFRYHGRELWICADCLPVMIHKRPLLMEKWAAQMDKPTADKG